ncbi:MAG: Rne/Rng family ribonuclease [Candidatus Omnitrophica bacterium]|nr:Rne/Rng family ribonuclease [Candidatus Omnitrophota bacterium]
MARRRAKKRNEADTGREILINVGPVETRIAIVANGKLMDFFMERKSVEHYAGSIFKGRVTAIVRGIDAAFVDIGLNKNGFLHAGDAGGRSAIPGEILADEDKPPQRVSKPAAAPSIEKILKSGQEIMVQVVKEAISTKGPRITTYISLPGRYIVLTPYDPHIGISRRIRDKEERKRIQDILKGVKLPEGMGCIVRTMAEERLKDELQDEMNYLLSLWKRIMDRSEKQPSPVAVYEEYGAVLRIVRDKFTHDVSRLTVDSRDEYARVMKFLKAFRPGFRDKVKLHTGRTPLFQKYDLDRKIDEIFERKVALKSGGYLVIEQTEGLIAIDVNTGKSTREKNLEETAYKTNVEAAREIPRQLMLRDIGGIIIIDFIDMEDRAHRESVFNVLQQELRDDKARISLRSISRFGVVEMTRQRMRKSLESASHVECPYCRGKGAIKSAETIAIETVREIDRVLSTISGRRKRIVVVTHPDINIALMSDQAKMLSDIQRKHRCNIELKEDPTLHREDVSIDKY